MLHLEVIDAVEQCGTARQFNVLVFQLQGHARWRFKPTCSLGHCISIHSLRTPFEVWVTSSVSQSVFCFCIVFSNGPVKCAYLWESLSVICPGISEKVLSL